MYIDKEQLAQVLFSYFDFNSPDGTNTYKFTGDKSMFNIGILKASDFEEIDDKFIYDLTDYIINMVK